MPYVVTCPKCPAKLKSQQAVPAGRTITCPQCKTTFTLSEPAKQVSDANVALPTKPPTPPKPPPAPKPQAAPEIIDGADFEFTAKPAPKPPRDAEVAVPPKAKNKREEEVDIDDEFAAEFDDEPTEAPSRSGSKNRVLLLGLIGIAAGFAMFCVLLLVLNLVGVFTLLRG